MTIYSIRDIIVIQLKYAEIGTKFSPVKSDQEIVAIQKMRFAMCRVVAMQCG